MPIRNRKKWYEKMSDWLEVPVSTMADIPVFTIRGKREIEVEGCTGSLESEENRIVLAAGRCGRFTVTGADLTLSDFRRRILLVRGEIASVRLQECDGTGEEENPC